MDRIDEIIYKETQNCGSRNIDTRKEGCKYMLGNALCGKNPACTSSGECEAPCSYYEK